MALNMKALRDRLGEERKRRNLTGFWRPSSGETYTVRFYTFEHEIDEHDYELGWLAKTDGKVGDVTTQIERVKEFIWPDGEKPVYEDPTDPQWDELFSLYEELRSSSNKMDKEKAKDLRPTTRYCMNVVVLDGPGADPSKIQLWDAPYAVWSRLMDDVVHPKLGEKVFGPKGHDYEVKFNANAMPQDMYKLTRIGRDSDTEDPDSKLKPKDLWNTDPRKRRLKGDPEEEEKRESAKPKRGRGRPKKAAPEPEEKEEEELAEGMKVECKDDDGKEWAFEGVVEAIPDPDEGEGYVRVAISDGDDEKCYVYSVDEVRPKPKRGRRKGRETR